MTTKVTQGVFVSDDDRGWYFVPSDRIDAFQTLLYSDNDDDCIKFDEEFAHCAIEGNPSNYKVKIIKRIN